MDDHSLTAQRKPRKLASLFRGLLKLGIGIYGLILTCVIISNLSIFSPNWPFSLIASFSETLILTVPVLLLFCLSKWKLAVFPIAALSGFAFYPVFTFDKFIQPSEQACASIECVSVVSANLRHHPEALVRLAETKAKDADILIIVELPYHATSEDLLSLFPMGGESEVAFLTDPGLQLGSRLAVISRKPLDRMTLELVQFPVSKRLQRGILRFDYAFTSGDPLSLIVVHPPPPKGPAETVSRNTYLQAAIKPLQNSTKFVLIGDFNMTPWEPDFGDLPGNRAGDPRWNPTWNARKIWQRITIDHALIGEGLNVQDFEVLPDVGSDHLPIHVIVQARNP